VARDIARLTTLAERLRSTTGRRVELLPADLTVKNDLLQIEKRLQSDERSAAAFANPDHVAITIDNYRWSLGLAEGEARCDALESKLATAPAIGVPSITMEGDANGAPHLDPSAYAKKFTGRREHRLIRRGIGHNLPQEAPQAFAQAIVDVDTF
jgi:hypothetical protein